MQSGHVEGAQRVRIGRIKGTYIEGPWRIRGTGRKVGAERAQRNTQWAHRERKEGPKRANKGRVVGA